MRYTKHEILEYVAKLMNDDNNDEYSDFIENGDNLISQIESTLIAYYLDDLDKPMPKDLDLLCSFIVAAQMELMPVYLETGLPVLPDISTTIKKVFYDDPFIHEVCSKSFKELDRSVWENFWGMTWGDGREAYYQIIEKLEEINEPHTFLAEKVIDYTTGRSTLSLASNYIIRQDDNLCTDSGFINPSEISVCVAKMYMMLCGNKKNAENMIASDIFNAELKGKKYDRIVCDPSSAMKFNSITPAEKDYLRNLSLKNPMAARCNSAAWIYVHKVASMLDDDGRAAVIIPTGSLTIKKDLALREMLVNDHMIEAVINMPAGKVRYTHEPAFYKTKMPLSIVVLKKGSDTVKSIDIDSLLKYNPDKYYLKNSIHNGIRTIDIDLLTDDLKEILNDDVILDESFSRTLTEEDLRESGYDLNSLRYTRNDSLIFNGVAFGKVIKSVRRGTSPKDGIRTDFPTDFYLMGSNICEVVTTIGLPNIEEPDEKLKKYCLKKGNIVITKNGVPKRSGIVETNDDELILATDNCYIIDLDTDVINPYYIASYLNSDRGRAALNRIAAGNTVKTISVSDLKELLIPCPPLAEQNSIAEKYEDALKELHLLRIREAELQESLTNIFFGEDV